jgi:rod shape determining protein RodA
MVFCFFFDYKQFERFANFIYLASVGSLTAVLFFGKYVGGSRRWLPLALFPFSPPKWPRLPLSSYWPVIMPSLSIPTGLPCGI